MTILQYESGKKLMDKARKLQKFHDAFHSDTTRRIKAYDSDGNLEVLDIEKGSGLYQIIDDYVGHQLAETRRQFDDI